MSELINGRTAEEIKRGLRCQGSKGNVKCNECAYCIGHFGDSDCDYECDQIDGDALALIEQLEAAVPRWISVEERLPEKLNGNNQVYITEEVMGFDGECAYIGQYKVYKYDGYRTFFDGNFFRDDITHWMPLPEEPKEGA
jgi:hypothetical protein